MASVTIYPNSTISSGSGDNGWTLGAYVGSSTLSASIHQTLGLNNPNISDVENSYIQCTTASQDNLVHFKVGYEDVDFNSLVPSDQTFDGITSVKLDIGWSAVPRRDVFKPDCYLTNAAGDSITQPNGGVLFWDMFGLTTHTYGTNTFTATTHGSGSGDWNSGAINDIGVWCSIDEVTYGDGTDDNEFLRLYTAPLTITYKTSFNPPATYTNTDDAAVNIKEGVVKINEGKVKVE